MLSLLFIFEEWKSKFFHLILAFVFTYYFDCCNCKCTNTQQGFNKKIVSNTTITELSIWSKSGVESPTACANDCGRDKRCVSFFYNTQSGVCTAHVVQFYSSESSIADEESLYYTLPVDKRDCAEVLNSDPDSPDGVYIINPDDDIGPARVYCDMSTGGGGWAVVHDCAEILSNDPDSPSGVYFINPGDGVGHFRVYCDMTTDGGGWTVFQRRQDGSVDFYKYWDDYKAGFGQVGAEFWLGFDYILRIIADRAAKLRIDMKDQENQTGYAKYNRFDIGDEASKFRLTATGFTGDRGDSLANHDEKKFTTRLKDYDHWDSGNCAEQYRGAWWFSNCMHSQLNGVYGEMSRSGILWNEWHGDKYSLKWVEMKLKTTYSRKRR